MSLVAKLQLHQPVRQVFLRNAPDRCIGPQKIAEHLQVREKAGDRVVGFAIQHQLLLIWNSAGSQAGLIGQWVSTYQWRKRRFQGVRRLLDDSRSFVKEVVLQDGFAL